MQRDKAVYSSYDTARVPSLFLIESLANASVLQQAVGDGACSRRSCVNLGLDSALQRFELRKCRL